MSTPDRSPSIVPPETGQDTYLVLDDFGGRLGRWRETDEEDTDRETLIGRPVWQAGAHRRLQYRPGRVSRRDSRYRRRVTETLCRVCRGARVQVSGNRQPRALIKIQISRSGYIRGLRVGWK
jgi:phosphate starvation-inducible protein PhoH